ncbi:Conserved_hypothetical protein [Hexamita inflata]|uniref:Uncharacterized protein n=1 Tax=Hexamita inflata TaxID=28002 RepID=A0ABP1JRZ1_9EUKA
MMSFNAAFSIAVKEHFCAVFDLKFETDRDVIHYFKGLSTKERKSIKWAWIGARVNITAAQAYKYFTATYQREALDPWPESTREAALLLCDQLFVFYYQEGTPEDLLRHEIVQDINLQLKLTEQVQHNYEQIYFAMRRRIHTLLCKKQKAEHIVQNENGPMTQNNSAEAVKLPRAKRPKADIDAVVKKISKK